MRDAGITTSRHGRHVAGPDCSHAIWGYSHWPGRKDVEGLTLLYGDVGDDATLCLVLLIAFMPSPTCDRLSNGGAVCSGGRSRRHLCLRLHSGPTIARDLLEPLLSHHITQSWPTTIWKPSAQQDGNNCSRRPALVAAAEEAAVVVTSSNRSKTHSKEDQSDVLPYTDS